MTGRLYARFTIIVAGMFLVDLPVHAADRVERGLIVRYDFTEGRGQAVHDRSGVGAPLDLVIEPAAGVRWSDGALTIESSTSIASAQPARKLIDAIKRSNAISIEVWLRPADRSQSGPARIVSLSADPSRRNVTLGQDGDACDVRLRASSSDLNGLPSTRSPGKTLRPQLTHVTFTRDAAGRAVLFIDGKQVVSRNVAGDFGNWDADYRLILANELTGDRPWLGDLHLVAMFDRALSIEEVRQNFAAGISAKPSATGPELVTSAAKDAFELQIAPLFARHCLECHDSAIRKGGLDLSRKSAALAGGDSGLAIKPGQAAQSLLWQSVASNEMPKNRPALSTEEKGTLRKWLDGGAGWPVEVIDPAIYAYANHSGEVWVQRLTVSEYIETVRSAVGVDIAHEAREFLPPDLRADGFSNTAYNLNVDFKHVEAYGKLAQIIVARMDVPAFAAKFSKSRSLSTDETMRDQVALMGKWLLRGPLDKREIHVYSGIATTVSSAGGSFDDAMRFIIEAMLQSPRFVYRVEDQRGDGAPRAAGPYELASRLSYILWGGPPDEELMRRGCRRAG